MHASRDELEPMVFGEYEGRTVDAGEMRIAFESMPAALPARRVAVQGAPRRSLPVRRTGATCSRARSGSPTSTGPRRSSTPARRTTCGPGHFVQTLEPVELIELSPVEEHDRTMATIARNLGLVAS